MKVKTGIGISCLVALPVLSALIFVPGSIKAMAGTKAPTATNSTIMPPSVTNIGEIVTSEGTFVRVNVPVSSLNVPKTAIAQSKDDVTKMKDYDVIVRPYGVFVLAGSPVAAKLFGITQSNVNSSNVSTSSQFSVNKNEALSEIKTFQKQWQKSH